MESRPEVTVTRDGDDITIAATGALDLFNCREFHDALLDVADSAERVTIDLRDAQYIDTAVLADVAVGANKMRARQKRLTVVVATPTHPHRALEITGLTAILDLQVEALPEPQDPAE